ncbi:MAG: hypothetical protein HGA96_03160 [Desulfobulbaceae bacterium]|nr:hypothetical protein [Desulfobulbaceae bacterium]
MWNKVARNIIAIGAISMLVGCATTDVTNRMETEATDSGYFLSFEQKRQLIWTGNIQDTAGTWYDIWIIPGYAKPAKMAKKNALRAGSDFAEYVQPEKYHAVAKHSKDAFKWAYDDCLVDFTVKGVPRAWGNYWASAERRANQRVFGWWFAYPWASLEGTVDTIVRVPAGLTGTALGVIWGAAAVPGYYATNSAVKGTWHFGVDAVIVPILGGTWNTMIAPPLSLVGQQPAPSRADGFWVKKLSDQDILTAKALETPISKEELAALADWGGLLLLASLPYEERRQTLRKEVQIEQAAINKKSQQTEMAIKFEEQETIRTLANNPSQQEIIARLQNGSFNQTRTSLASEEVRKYLAKQNQLSQADIQRLLVLLREYPPTQDANQTLRAKTDPVTHSLKVINRVDSIGESKSTAPRPHPSRKSATPPVRAEQPQP